MKKLLLLLTIITLSISCTKEGPAGQDGKDGNANVTSLEITVYNQDWQNNNGTYGVAKPISQITQDIASNGTVLVYYKGADNYYFALPFGPLAYGYATGVLTILTDNESFTQNTNIFKVVLIAGTPSSSVDMTNYRDVANYYNISDK